MNTQHWLDLITEAGFVKFTNTGLAVSDDRLFKPNYSTDCYFHASVPEMPEEEQLQQPWIEHIVWKGPCSHYKDEVEGRFGSMRFPFRELEDLRRFMETFGYTNKLLA